MTVEYAWRQPDGVVAPVLTTEDYDLMVNILGDWVRVADLIKLALKPGQMGNKVRMDRAEVYVALRALVAEALNQFDAGMAVDVEAQYDALADQFSGQTRESEGPATRQVREAQECRPTAPCGYCRERLAERS